MEGGSPVTAWRTTCLYGVSYSRASPRLFVGVTSSVSDRPHVADVRVRAGSILSPHGALRAYTVFLTDEPLRGSTRVLSSSVTFPDVPQWCNFFSIRCGQHALRLSMKMLSVPLSRDRCRDTCPTVPLSHLSHTLTGRDKCPTCLTCLITPMGRDKCKLWLKYNIEC